MGKEKRWTGTVRKLAFLLFCILPVVGLAAGLPRQTYTAGELLWSWDKGGRLLTWHNGYLYMIGLDKSYVYDLSDPRNPVIVTTGKGNNTHRWVKFGNAFWGDLGLADAMGTGYNFLDLSALPDLKPYTGDANIEVKGKSHYLLYWTYPHRYKWNGLVDVRTGEVVGSIAPSSLKTVDKAGHEFRIGNLWFYTSGDEKGGMAVVDVGNPANPKILDELKGDIGQYTNTVQIWRHYVILMLGKNTNQGGNSTIAIDFSDPENLNVAWGFPNTLSVGRYANFQDEFGFFGFSPGVKFNMETQEVVQTFKGVHFMSDFQWVPLGNLVIQSASENCTFPCMSSTHIFAHQDAPDTRPPSVGYHLPGDGALRQPLGTVVGLVINETLLDTTLTDKTIIIRPVGGQPIATDIVSYSFDVINIAPRENLLPNTTYEVELVEGGIKDVSGNGIKGKKFYFSTGTTLDPPQKNLHQNSWRNKTSALDPARSREIIPKPYRPSFRSIKSIYHRLPRSSPSFLSCLPQRKLFVVNKGMARRTLSHFY